MTIKAMLERSLSKSALCDVAIAQLSRPLDRSECLLIDNRPENVTQWIAQGGAGYQFQGEAQLARDFDRLVI